MFFVINKEKLTTYFVAIVTVLVLFIMAGTINPTKNTIETSGNIQNNTQADTLNDKDNKTDNNTCIENSINKILEIKNE